MSERAACIGDASAVGAGTRRPVLLDLLPIMAAVLVAFFSIGLALPVLPLHVSGLVVAAGAGLRAAFDVSALVVLGAGVVALRLLRVAPPGGR